MLFLLSPAKSLDYESPLPPGLATTTPAFMAQAQALIAQLRSLAPQQVASLMRMFMNAAGLSTH